MNYGIPPNPGGHITGVDILLNKRTAQINYRHNISLNMFHQFDIKYNYIDYIHLELVNEERDNNDIFELYNIGDYHVGLAKETHNLNIEFNAKKSVLGLEFNKKLFTPTGFYLTPETSENSLSIYGFLDKEILNSDLNFELI